MLLATVALERGREQRLLRGHPWVYRTEISGLSGDFQPGELVEVVDYRGRFLGRGYINPGSMITVRLLTRDRNEAVDEAFFRKRLQEAWNYRKLALAGADTDSCRVVFGEADFLPGLIVDKFADCLVLQTLTLGIDRYKEMLAGLLDELIRPKAIYEQNHAAVRELEGLELRSGFLRGSCHPVLTIRENGLSFGIDLTRGQKTGYFLDQRENRAALRYLAGGARVLDCFCYTGGFSLHAARYGAAEVLGLDISGEAVEMARRNAAANGYGEICRFEEANAFDALREMERRQERFDLVILDPPAFVKSRRSLEGAVRGYKEINLRAMKLIRQGGFLVTCSCSYHMQEELFLDVVESAAIDARRRLRVIAKRGQSLDHPWLLGYDESRYLKCLILQVL